eukprot:5108799-Prymnesium_polylepis.1
MQVVHVLARPHHHDQPLAREAHHVRARQVAPCVECAVGGELCAVQQALQRQRQSCADISMLAGSRHASIARRSA